MRGHGFETVQQTNLLLLLEKKAACNAGPGSRLFLDRIVVAGGAVYAACNAGLRLRLLKDKIGVAGGAVYAACNAKLGSRLP